MSNAEEKFLYYGILNELKVLKLTSEFTSDIFGRFLHTEGEIFKGNQEAFIKLLDEQEQKASLGLARCGIFRRTVFRARSSRRKTKGVRLIETRDSRISLKGYRISPGKIS